MRGRNDRSNRVASTANEDCFTAFAMTWAFLRWLRVNLFKNAVFFLIPQQIATTRLQRYFILIYFNMGLKTIVKVGCITNLSDARYCAGMGVDMLGFRAHPSQPEYVDPVTFHEMRGWFSGPKIVAELYGVATRDELDQVIEDYQPDLVEISPRELDKLQPIHLPFILSISEDEYRSFAGKQPGCRYLLVSSANESFIREVAGEYAVLLDSPEMEVQQTLRLPVAGIALLGSSEEKPGYKTYEQLAAVLEELEQD